MTSMEVGDQAEALVGDGGGEVDAAGLEVGDGFVDVVGVEGDGVGVGRRGFGVCGVDAEVGFGEVEDEPAFADVVGGEVEFVFEEGAEGGASEE